MSRRDNGAQWFAGNSLKFRVGGVFVNGKMTISLSGNIVSRHCFGVFKAKSLKTATKSNDSGTTT